MIATRTVEELIAKNQEFAKDIPKIQKGDRVQYMQQGVPGDILTKIVEKMDYIDITFVIFNVVTHSYYAGRKSETFSYHFFKDGIEVASYIPGIDMTRQYPVSAEHDGLQFQNRWHPLTDRDLAQRFSTTCELRRRELDRVPNLIQSEA